MDAGKSIGVGAAGQERIAPGSARKARHLLPYGRVSLPRLTGARMAFPRASGDLCGDGLEDIQQFPVPDRRIGSPKSELSMRVFDVVLSGLLLLLLAPLMLVIALIVRCDSAGGALFRQTRYGLGGVPFTIFKFRTMTCTDNGTGMVQATRNDPRVTRVGRWLRKLSLDELPQILNVLNGSMSLVGPRPHAVDMDWRFAREFPYYGQRFLVRPGITGLAQLRGLRGEITCDTQIRKRVLHDIVYIRRRSLTLYLQILVSTVAVVLFQQEAY